MGHLLKSTSGQYIEFEIRDTGGSLITDTGGLTVLVAKDSVSYVTGVGAISIVNGKRYAYSPTSTEVNGHTFRIEASHVSGERDYFDVFDMIPITDVYNRVSIYNTLPDVDVSGRVTINNSLPEVDGSGWVTINNDLPDVDASGRVTVTHSVPTVDINGYVTINNNLPAVDGSGYVTINNDLPILDSGGNVYANSMPTLSEIKTQVVSAISGDTYPEPVQGTPASTTSLASKIGMLYKATINHSEQEAGEYRLYNSSGTTVDHKAATDWDAVTFTREKIVSGP